MPDSDECQDFNSCVFFKLLTCTFRTFTFVTFYSFLHFLAMGERGFSRNIGTCQLRDFPDLFPTFATFLARTSSYEPEKFIPMCAACLRRILHSTVGQLRYCDLLSGAQWHVQRRAAN